MTKNIPIDTLCSLALGCDITPDASLNDKIIAQAAKLAQRKSYVAGDRNAADAKSAAHKNPQVKYAISTAHKKPARVKYALTAACLAIVAVATAIVVPLLSGGSDFDLTLSNAVVRYIDNPPSIHSSYSLVYRTEEELFAEDFNGYEIVVFEGVVSKVENILIDFGARHTSYRAIITIDVSEVYRGSLEAGASVTVLLQSPVQIDGDETRVWVSDSSVSSQMTVGTTGIFMPIKYDETSIYEANGKTVFLVELAQYGLPDGERWAFIETADGLLFSRDAYESAASAATMGEIRQYVLNMLQK